MPENDRAREFADSLLFPGLSEHKWRVFATGWHLVGIAHMIASDGPGSEGVRREMLAGAFMRIAALELLLSFHSATRLPL